MIHFCGFFHFACSFIKNILVFLHSWSMFSSVAGVPFALSGWEDHCVSPPVHVWPTLPRPSLPSPTGGRSDGGIPILPSHSPHLHNYFGLHALHTTIYSAHFRKTHVSPIVMMMMRMMRWWWWSDDGGGRNDAWPRCSISTFGAAALRQRLLPWRHAYSLTWMQYDLLNSTHTLLLTVDVGVLMMMMTLYLLWWWPVVLRYPIVDPFYVTLLHTTITPFCYWTFDV